MLKTSKIDSITEIMQVRGLVRCIMHEVVCPHIHISFSYVLLGRF